MFDTLIAVLIGAFIGWHFPEPIWAKFIKQKVMSYLSKDKK